MFNRAYRLSGSNKNEEAAKLFAELLAGIEKLIPQGNFYRCKVLFELAKVHSSMNNKE